MTDLIAGADRALYQAKNAGRNHVWMFTDTGSVERCPAASGRLTDPRRRIISRRILEWGIPPRVWSRGRCAAGCSPSESILAEGQRKDSAPLRLSCGAAGGPIRPIAWHKPYESAGQVAVWAAARAFRICGETGSARGHAGATALAGRRYPAWLAPAVARRVEASRARWSQSHPGFLGRASTSLREQVERTPPGQKLLSACGSGPAGGGGHGRGSFPAGGWCGWGGVVQVQLVVAVMAGAPFLRVGGAGGAGVVQVQLVVAVMAGAPFLRVGGAGGAGGSGPAGGRGHGRALPPAVRGAWWCRGGSGPAGGRGHGRALLPAGRAVRVGPGWFRSSRWSRSWPGLLPAGRAGGWGRVVQVQPVVAVMAALPPSACAPDDGAAAGTLTPEYADTHNTHYGPTSGAL